MRGKEQIRDLLRPHRGALALALAGLLIQSAATLLQPWIAGVLTSRLVVGGELAPLLWVLFGLVVLQAGVGYFVAVRLQAVSGRLMADAGVRVYAHLQALPLAWHHGRRRGDVLALLTGDIYRLGGYLTGTLVPLLPLLLTFLGALAMMLNLAPAIALAVGALLPAIFIALKFVGRRLRPLGHAATQAWADQSALAEQNLAMLALIKSHGGERIELERYRQVAARAHEAELRQARLADAVSPAVQVVGAGVILALIGLAGHLVADSSMSLGDLVSLFLYGLVLVSPVSRLARVYGDTQAMKGTVRRLAEAMDSEVEADAGTRELSGVRGEIRFEGVDFTYPGRPPLLQGFDLTVAAGETLAITGPNGSGKSTLAALMARLLEPQGGRITLDGVDLRELTRSSLHDAIGLVSQDVLLFNASVAENLAYGRPDCDAAAIEAAARLAGAHDFITALPEGYQTVVGDQAVRLSGGQKQRLALARCLLRAPQVMVLDEATSMFDLQGEGDLIARCGDFLRGRTVVIVTHRSASLALADRVVEIDAGKISRVG